MDQDSSVMLAAVPSGRRLADVGGVVRSVEAADAAALVGDAASTAGFYRLAELVAPGLEGTAAAFERGDS